MAEPKKVYECDCCTRVVARLQDGKLKLTQRHDGKTHETTIDLTKLVIPVHN